MCGFLNILNQGRSFMMILVVRVTKFKAMSKICAKNKMCKKRLNYDGHNIFYFIMELGSNKKHL